MKDSKMSYDTKERFASYWNQINEVAKLNPRSVLEVGIGYAFVSSYLRRWGFNVTTLDVCREFQPDVTGSVICLPLKTDFFDLCLCCEVLEHLPYSEFTKALQELRRVSSSYVVLSLPDASSYIGLQIKGLIGLPPKLLSLPQLSHRKHVFNGYHYWEIGKQGYSLGRILRVIQGSNFGLERTYRLFDCPYHRMFVLRKTNVGS
jgi:ubiquinone/menaquinone biosynthesis C-methylase UbiE